MEWLYENYPQSKTTRWIILFVFFLIISFCQNVDADSNFVPGEIIVKLKPHISPQEGMTIFSGSDPNPFASLLPELKGRNVTYIKNVFRDESLRASSMTIAEDGGASALSNIFRINLSGDGDIDSLVSALENNPNVEYAQLNHYLELCLVPNDPYLGSSGSWGNTFEDMWGFYKIQADKAWDYTTGKSDVVVAVIDSGVDYTHEELKDRVINGYDFSDRDDDSMDEDGHGTHVAGIIAAAGDNSKGIVGMSWKSRILAVKIFPHGTEVDGAQAIKYAADHVCGVNVINMSWNVYGADYSSVLSDAIEYASEKNIVLVAAAGNDNGGSGDVANYTPANHRDVIAVAATDEDDKRCLFSNKGKELAVCAPGGGNGDFYDRYNVLSLRSKNLNPAYDPLLVGNGYVRMAGTSMAAPYVSGLAALILSKNPSLTKGEVESIIKFSTDDLGEPGFDEEYGYGRINAYEALKRTPSPAEDIGEVPEEELEKSEKIEPPEWVKDLRVGDMAMDNNGNMFVVYTNQHRIIKYKLAPSGMVRDSTALCSTSIFSSDDDGLYYPMAVAVSPSGDRVYVADTYKQRVLIYDGDLKPINKIATNVYGIQGVLKYYYYWPVLFFVREVRGGTPQEFWPAYMSEGEKFYLPMDLSISGNDLFVADSDGHRILKYNIDGRPSYFDEIKLDLKNRAKQEEDWGRKGYDVITKSYMIAWNAFVSLFTGRYEIIDYYFRSNQVHDLILPDASFDGCSTGEPKLYSPYHIIPSPGPSNIDGRLSSSTSIAVDSSGCFYIADTGNDRVQKFAPDGSFVCKFGEGELSSPKGIDIDAYGHIWVADTGNKRIVQFDAMGNFMEEYKPFNLRFAGGM